jgi:hypothetical protein
MLVIRKSQLDALGAVMLSSFESKMVSHLKKVYPDWAQALPPAELLGFVRHGMSRAKRHGFLTELEVARYLHVMHDLGKTFDESPEYPWAQPLLAADMPPAEKMDRLRDAVDYRIEARRIGDARRR